MDKIFFEIEPRQQNNEITYIAKIQMSDLLKNKQMEENFSQKIEFIENLYKETIMFCKQKFAEIKKSWKQDRIFLYWNIGNKLQNFLNNTARKGFFFNYANKHFARDLNLTERTIGRLLYFRKKVASTTTLDPTKPWTYYVRRYYRLKEKESRNE